MGNNNYKVTFKYSVGTLEWLDRDKIVLCGRPQRFETIEKNQWLFTKTGEKYSTIIVEKCKDENEAKAQGIDQAARMLKYGKLQEPEIVHIEKDFGDEYNKCVGF